MFGFNSILLLIVLAGAGGGYVWYQNNEEEKARMIAEMAIKETQLALAEEARLRAEEDRMLMTQVLNDLETKFDNAQDSYGRLEKKFNKVSKYFGTRDIGKLAENKPGPIGKVITNASKNALRCFEILSGSPLSEAEIAAVKPSQINSECPSLANPNYKPEEE
jgi:hypothetical protein